MKTNFIEDGALKGVAKNQNKKQVLLIGDSIRMGYCEVVKEKLLDVADVYFPDENCRSSQHIITSLGIWQNLCDGEKIDVVQFNCGHWDVARWHEGKTSLSTPREYQRNVGKIINYLRKYYPNAKIVFATSTPMNPNGSNSSNARTTKDIIKYNKKGIKATLKEKAIVNDLFEFTKDFTENDFRDYAHFNEQTNEKIGTFVADFIRKLL